MVQGGISCSNILSIKTSANISHISIYIQHAHTIIAVKTIEAGCRENLAVAVGPWLLSGFRQCQTLCSQRAPYPQQQGRQTVPQ